MEKLSLGCVYFFKHVGISPIKIGYSESESPIFRFEQFKTYAPFGAELVGFIRTAEAKKLETDLHRKYARDRIKGEWFEITVEECNKCISFYSNIIHIEEFNNFQIQWAKSLSDTVLDNESLEDSLLIFLKNYSIEKRDGFEEVVTNQTKISDFLNIDKSIVKRIFKNFKLKEKSYRVLGEVKSGVKIYKKPYL